MKKKKIILLSDDMRSTSGIATMSRELVLGTCHKYDWFQVGSMINHPEFGKLIDVSGELNQMYNTNDINVKILPYNSYGDLNLIRELLSTEKPDAILHFTDPHYWQWLYDIEHEIRQQVPLLFYHVWDDLPDPNYNRNFYESCDWIGCISKQTFGIVNRVGKSKESITYKPLQDWQIKYVPHGINPDVFKPTQVSDSVKNLIFGGKEYEFIIFFNNRNIRRKKPSDVIYAYNNFCEQLPLDKANKCLLLMHTTAIDDNGTDLFAVKEALCPKYDVKINDNKILQGELNEIYNLVDCTINISNNEGFGLTTAESIMSGTPVIVNVTGGLQDQCGFNIDGKEFSEFDYIKYGSLHNKKKWDMISHGDWSIPVWSSSQTLNGSPVTPYIFDDNLNLDDVTDAMMRMYNLGKEQRKKNGIKGREWALKNLSSKNMCDKMIEGIETCLNNFKKREKFDLYKIV
jgi:glycosyltransferase involved in cell wall biosynthesis